MKNLLLLVFATILLVGCEDLETNNPAMQGTIDHTHFKAIDARATLELDGTYLIKGINQNEILSLRISGAQEGNYNLGGEFQNEASYTDPNGIIYTTRPHGDGKVIVTNWDNSGKTLTGTFNFNAILEGIDTITVHQGIFFEVPYSVAGGDPIIDAGTVNADVGGEPWEASTVTAIDNGESIIIKSSTVSIIIRIKVPREVEPGEYQLPSVGFNATYDDDDTVQEPAISGSITVLEHDIVGKTIKGTFFFETVSQSITSGEFDVTYQ